MSDCPAPRETWRQAGEAAADAVAELRFRRQVERIYRLGPRAVGELLAEIGERHLCRTYIDQRIEAYAALDPETVRALGEREFPRPPLHEVIS